jgi:hypothetical protein
MVLEYVYYKLNMDFNVYIQESLLLTCLIFLSY